LLRDDTFEAELAHAGIERLTVVECLCTSRIAVPVELLRARTAFAQT